MGTLPNIDTQLNKTTLEKIKTLMLLLLAFTVVDRKNVLAV